MSFRIETERVFLHPAEKVWQALTDPDALAAWLMPNNFAPETGRPFQMDCGDGEEGHGTLRCRVLELEPPHRMVWEWKLDDQPGRSTVEFLLAGVEGGTRLTIRHGGDWPESIALDFENGWPGKLDHLADQLA